jgi:hypothetical protein
MSDIKDDVLDKVQDDSEADVVDIPGDSQTDEANEDVDVADDSDTDTEPEGKKGVPEASVIKWKRKYREMKDAHNKLLASKGIDEAARQIADKYGFEEDAISEILTQAESRAIQTLKKETGELQKERLKEKVENAFNSNFDKLVKDNPKLESKKAILKQLAFSKPHANKTLNQIAEEVYGDLMVEDKSSSESNAKPNAKEEVTTLDFEEVHKSAEKRLEVLKNPGAKAAYFDWLDKKGI